MLRLAALIAALAWPAAAWAQAAEATGVAVKAAESVLSTGPVAAVLLLYGLLASVVAIALWYRCGSLEGMLKDCQDKRLSDVASFMEKAAESSSDAKNAILANNKTLEGFERIINAAFELAKTLPPLVADVKTETIANRGRVDALNDAVRERLRGPQR